MENKRTTVVCCACKKEVTLKGKCPNDEHKHMEVGYLTTCYICGDWYFRYPDHVNGYGDFLVIRDALTKPRCECK